MYYFVFKHQNMNKQTIKITMTANAMIPSMNCRFTFFLF